MKNESVNINNAVKVLNNGGIIIFPTDTAFGIGCRIDNEKAVKKLFDIRKRPYAQATPVLVNSPLMAEKYFLSPTPFIVRHLIKKYWPGALTIVYKAEKEKVPELVRGGKDNVGVRMPDHPLTLEIIRKAGVSILGPSANFHGKPTPYKYEELDPGLMKLVDLVVDGKCKTGLASTVVDCTVDPIYIIRQGSIKL